MNPPGFRNLLTWNGKRDYHLRVKVFRECVRTTKPLIDESGGGEVVRVKWIGKRSWLLPVLPHSEVLIHLLVCTRCGESSVAKVFALLEA